MILAYVVIIFVIAALLLRRDLSLIGQLPYRGGWLVAVLVITIFAAQAKWAIYVNGPSNWQGIILILSQAGLLLLALNNYHLPGAKLFALGVFLNVLVMSVNGGWMPLEPDMYRFVHPDHAIAVEEKPFGSKNVVLPRHKTNLWFLADVIPVTLPWRQTVVSIGDVMMMAAAARFVFGGTAANRIDPGDNP